MKPIESLGANLIGFGATTGTDDFDFLLEGVPTLSAYALQPGPVDSEIAARDASKVELEDLRHNIAVVAVTTFGVAERTAPIGPRESNAEIESLLVTLGLDLQMKSTEAWKQWQSGERGRLP
jgi:hypothetical protein